MQKTLGAAIDIDYPHKTYLLDDGQNPQMKRLARKMGAIYLARPTNEDAKAGNLNYGLAHSEGEYVAIFDSDHVPNKKFLNETLGYFKDPKVAFVQTPQDFYNTSSFLRVCNSPARAIMSSSKILSLVTSKISIAVDSISYPPKILWHKSYLRLFFLVPLLHQERQ